MSGSFSGPASFTAGFTTTTLLAALAVLAFRKRPFLLGDVGVLDPIDLPRIKCPLCFGWSFGESGIDRPITFNEASIFWDKNAVFNGF